MHTDASLLESWQATGASRCASYMRSPDIVCGHPTRPVLKREPTSLICVRVKRMNKPVRRKEANWREALKAVPSNDPDILRMIRARACLLYSKDGKLCLRGAKIEETLVKDCKDTEVQIMRLTWV